MLLQALRTSASTYAHASMRMDALADVIQRDPSVKKVYLLNQDYSRP